MMKTLFIKILRFLMLLVFIASCGIGYVIYEDTLTAGGYLLEWRF